MFIYEVKAQLRGILGFSTIRSSLTEEQARKFAEELENNFDYVLKAFPVVMENAYDVLEEQLHNIEKYELEMEYVEGGRLLYVWDTEDKQGRYFKFNKYGYLVDMY